MANLKAVPNAPTGLGQPFITIHIAFGPTFAYAKSNADFIDRLRAEASQHPKSFLSHMLEHAADHVAAADPGGSKTPHLSVSSRYYEVGSCTTCGSGKCCLCEYDGQLWCEEA